MILLVADLWTLGWAGFGAGMAGGEPHRDRHWCSESLVLPWILWILLATVLGLSFSQTGGDDSLMWLMIFSWFVIALGNDIYWMSQSRISLLSHFREIATRRPEEARRWFRFKRHG